MNDLDRRAVVTKDRFGFEVLEILSTSVVYSTT